ncbi:MAG: glycerol-3-phosphate 1-O-acyltransferase PlsY [Immundisolibacteraceae bacterium]|nr:glycerol-3-phosphate 1-O-acyltransferase PlsY [Immundisolibacteraceae bacterium]
MIDSLLIITAYLLGSLSSAIITCRLLGLPDPRDEGSGNPGTTNVLRIGGKKAALITLTGDFLKGFLPVVVALTVTEQPLTVAATLVAAFIGHLLPVFFRFQGGKGVATAAGCLFGLALPIGLAAVASWVVIAAVTRLSSLAALITALAAPFITHWVLSESTYTMGVALMAAMILLRHHQNIKKLLAGTESRIGGTKPTVIAADDS